MYYYSFDVNIHHIIYLLLLIGILYNLIEIVFNSNCLPLNDNILINFNTK